MWAALRDLKQLSWHYQNGFIGDGKFWILIINSEILNSSTAEPVKMTSFKERWFPLRGHTFIMFTENEQFRDLPTPFISKNKQQIYCLETKNAAVFMWETNHGILRKEWSWWCRWWSFIFLIAKNLKMTVLIVLHHWHLR